MPEPIDRDALWDELNGPNPPTLIEALGAAFYADAHLPGALNLPPAHVGRLAAELLPDPDARIVVYGSGSGESGHIVARRLELLGYPHVLLYRGGKEDWVEHGLPIERPAEPRFREI